MEMKIYNLYDEVEDYKLEWLVDELIPYSEPTIIYGAMSSGKTINDIKEHYIINKEIEKELLNFKINK